jgi:hypothetical protein
MNWSELAPGLKFKDLKEEDQVQERFPGFSIWDWGTGRFARILGGMEREFPGGEIAVLDYEYEHSRNMYAPSTPGMQRGLTLCFLKFEGLDLPEIYQRNEAPIQKMFKRAAGRHDIYFAEDPDFSERFEIQGPELEVHRLYRPEVRSYFIRHFEYSPLRIEMRGDTILIHFGMMIEPEDSRLLLYRIAEIAGFWADRKIEFDVPPDFFFSNGAKHSNREVTV